MFFALLLFAASNFCEPDAVIRKALVEADTPSPLSESKAARRSRLASAAQKIMQQHPADIWAHRLYVDALVEQDRSTAIEEYESLLAKSPKSPALLYGAARAQHGRKTPEAIRNLEAGLKLEPGLAPAHALLAEIYASAAFRDVAKIRRHLDLYSKACPDSVELAHTFAWLDDTSLQAEIAARARPVLDRHPNPPPAEMLKLWNLESKMTRSDQRAQMQERWRADVKRLMAEGVPRTNVWFSALGFMSNLLGDPAIETSAAEEMARLYPESSHAASLASSRWHKANPSPREADNEEAKQKFYAAAQSGYRELSLRFPLSAGLTFTYWRNTVANRKSSNEDLAHAFAAVNKAIEADPEAMLISPPVQCDIAESLLERNFRVDAAPALIRKCIEITEKHTGMGTESDLYPRGKQATDETRDMWYLFAYLPLADAHIRLQQKASAADILSQVETKLQRIRPPADGSSEDKARHAEMEARFWHMKGRFAEMTGRKLDALVLYRNALTTFPPRRHHADSRGTVMADARRLWTELGGSEPAWNDWASKSPLDRFHAGAGAANAWVKLAESKPALEVIDVSGKKWKPAELAAKTTFVNMWATWCGPCREELPYLERLAKQTPDAVVIALNVDEDAALAAPFLKRLKLELQTTLARDFAYDYFPAMALPANWIVDGKGTRMFHTESEGDAWVKEAEAAVISAREPKPVPTAPQQ